MRDTGFVYQLRQLRQKEQAGRLNLTPQAMTVLALRLATIEKSDYGPEEKGRLIEKSKSQWAFFMQRPLDHDFEVPF